MVVRRIGDYEIIDKLGVGGFGTVWKATSSHGTTVALKILNPQAIENERVVKKFFHEAMILAKLDHRNITKLFEFFPDEKNYAIAMEFVEGYTLKDLIKEKNNQVPLEQALDIAKQSLSAFHYAHQNGILHRDIKPGNIMIDNHNVVKIMDFGIARMSTTATHETASRMLSVHYTPPERFDSRKEVDQRSDIYSLGIAFYEMFAGRRPFTAEDTSQIMFSHLNEIPEPPERYAPGLPTHISEAILKSLEKDPEDRFNDFREYGQAMDPGGAVLDEATREVDLESTQIDAAIGRPAEYEKKKKPALMIIPIAVVVIGLLIGGYFAYEKYYLEKPIEIEQPVDKTRVDTGQVNVKGFSEFTHPKDSSLMTIIPAGEFTMGSDSYSAEKPVQKISLDQYCIDKYPVTNEKYQKFVEATQYVTDAEKEGAGMVRIGRRWKKVEEASWKKPDGLTPIEGKEDYPVSQVSYNDALKYCQWAGKDLPTEAQWEKAARGPDGNEYPWGNSEPDDTTANFDNLIGSPTPVTEYEKGQSYYGAYDMAGNVYQWCKDWYATGKRKDKKPTGPDTGKERVIKGGSFIEGMESIRSANRDRYEPNYSSFLFGFRCACEYDESFSKPAAK